MPIKLVSVATAITIYADQISRTHSKVHFGMNTNKGTDDESIIMGYMYCENQNYHRASLFTKFKLFLNRCLCQIKGISYGLLVLPQDAPNVHHNHLFCMRPWFMAETYFYAACILVKVV
jgi:hypothetical protein